MKIRLSSGTVPYAQNKLVAYLVTFWERYSPEPDDDLFVVLGFCHWGYGLSVILLGISIGAYIDETYESD